MQTHTNTYKLHSLIQYNKACGSAHDSPHSPQGHLDSILRVEGAAQLCPTAAYQNAHHVNVGNQINIFHLIDSPFEIMLEKIPNWGIQERI